MERGARTFPVALGLALAAAVSAGAAARTRPPGSPSLQAMVDHAPDGGTVRLAPGVYAGPVVVTRGIRLKGSRAAVIRSDGQGTTVRLLGEGCALVGVTVDGSGTRPDRQDAGVYVRGAGIRVEDVVFRHCLFGIWAESSQGLVLEHNRISGDPALPLGMRGDGIHLWEVRDSLVRGNTVRDCQDVVVWYSKGNRLEDNRVVDCRYGTHFMYSDDNVVVGGRYVGDVVGIFCMYSRGLRVLHCDFEGCVGVTGWGFGAKESGDLLLWGDRFAADSVGVHLDNSPFEPGDRNVIRTCRFLACDSAVAFNGASRGCVFEDNAFLGNRRPLDVDGNVGATRTRWRRNYFDDYQGYDLSAGGYGDVPYECRSFVGDMVRRHPAVGFFLGTPAFALLGAAGRVLPLYEPTLLMSDAHPRMAPPSWGAGHGD